MDYAQQHLVNMVHVYQKVIALEDVVFSVAHVRKDMAFVVFVRNDLILNKFQNKKFF